MRHFLILLLWLAAAPAWAHAVLLDTQPGDGMRLDAAPAEIRARFNEPVDAIAVRLIDAQGQTVAGPAATATDSTVTLPVPANLSAGLYIVSYRVTSADSHPVAGSVQFGIGIGPTAEGQAHVAGHHDGDRLSWVAALNRALFYASLFVAAGSALFIVLVNAGTPAGRVLSGAAALAIVTGAARIGLQGLALADLPAGALASVESWRVGASTTLGQSIGLTIVGLAAMLLGRRSTPVVLSGAIIAVGAVALTGHAATAQPRWVTTPAIFVHALCVAFWLGALWPLDRALARPDAVAIVRRFSVLAGVAVALLVASGAAIAANQVRGWAPLVDTDYGRTLLVKLGLVAALLLLAAWNKWRLTPELARGETTVLLGQTPPPRALNLHEGHAHGAGEAAAGIAVVTSARDRQVLIEIDPGRAGRNTIELTFSDTAGRVVTPLEVSLFLAQSSAGIEPILRQPEKVANGRYRLTGPELAVAGRWLFRVEMLVTDFDRLVFETDIDIKP